MKKEILAFIALCFFICPTRLFSQVNQPEVVLYSEINLSYKNGFYPGVIEKFNTLKDNYPESVYILPSAILKGESLVHLNRYKEARELLEKIIPSVNIGDHDYEKVCFFLGQSAFYLNDFDYALKYLHECMSACKRESDYVFYGQACFYTARILYELEAFDKVLPFLEYAVSNGKSFSKSEYDEMCQKLAVAYNKNAVLLEENAYYFKNVNFFDQLNQNAFSVQVYDSLKLQAAVALENIGSVENIKKAYDYYCDIICSGIKELAVLSMQKAYILSKNNPTLKLDTNVLFEITEKSFSDDPSLLCEFWIRLGIDSYNLQNYQDAMTYLESAEQLCEEGTAYKIISKIYQCKIDMIDIENDVLSVENAASKENQPSIQKKTLSQIEQNVEAIRTEVDALQENQGILKISDAYYSLLIQIKAKLSKWNEIPLLYECINQPDNDSSYIAAMAYFNLKDFEKAYALLKEIDYDSKQEYVVLFASVCSLTGRLKEAEKLYSVVNAPAVEQNLEYAKVLYKLKKYSESLEFAKKAVLNQKNKAAVQKTANSSKNDSLVYAYYLCGLNEVNLGRWKDAVSDFSVFLKNVSDEENFYRLSALFYAGYCCYVSGRFEEAYRYFDACNVQKKYTDFASDAYEYAAKSALQLKKFDEAAVQAERFVKSVKSREKEEKAVLFCASVLSDGKKYGRAVELLKPYTLENNDFAAQALMETARIYQKNQNFDLMEKSFEEIVTRFAKSEAAQEALYSCGEAYHAEGEFEKAEEKFGRYIYKYVDGIFAERALYYSGDCNFRLGKLERSVMLNSRLVTKYPSSIYLYAAYKNLLEANYRLAHYEDALKAAEMLEKKFAAQAESDGIVFRISELKKIVSGQDSAIAKKSAEFEKNGGLKTAKGRKTGSELVKLYCQSQETEQEGILLALQLLPLQQVNFPAELAEAAVNADLIAGWYRKNGSDKEAAETYLLAAEYYKASSEDTEKTAYSLYCAAEAFAAAGMKGDARETANLLIQLYPESRYSENVVRFR